MLGFCGATYRLSGVRAEEEWVPVEEIVGSAEATMVLEIGPLYIDQARRDVKVESDPARPRLLVTEPGVGYRMKES